ncbi:MAG TPA: HyaD/HybD family hydrogenase maturation endopeptidase [Piscirickettsiaceae bacterium]|nr:HyaD/HybD family hydrogenase maturation endopeptidase [Piscirickettsiaceae bacterium]HIQ40798.1 HyaD/HybD family hydrogenase maturation endopeptidase [Sulfurivirga caldicuralii]
MKTLILGIGNLLWADEGFGVRCVERMAQRYRFDESVELMDGGTQGIYLIHNVEEADNLIVFDAVDYGLAPGTIKVVEDDEVPKFMGAKKVSLHQTGFQEVLATVMLKGSYPQRLVLIGVQPEEIEDYGGSLRPVVKAQIDPCVEIALDYLKRWGIEPVEELEDKRDCIIGSEALALDRYEAEQPQDRDLWAKGDPRVLLDEDVRFEPKKVLQESDMSVCLHQQRVK